MVENAYLRWLAGDTPSFWWHDSAELSTMDEAIASGATGVTTNPLLVKRSLYSHSTFWAPYLRGMMEKPGTPAYAEEIIRRITREIARKFEGVYAQSHGAQGYVCAQVRPDAAGDREAMASMGRRLAGWAENIAVKLPVTAAGLDVLEDMTAEGISVVATVSFTLPQVLAAGARHMAGIRRARAAGKPPGRCFAVVMVGRLDDYLRDVALDARSAVREEDIIVSGTAVIKRAYRMFGELGYEAILMPAGMRGADHAHDLAGANMSMSLSPGIQKALAMPDYPFAPHIGEDVPAAAIERLMTIPEFVKAYEPDGMKSNDFIAYGATQRTLSQFVETGWLPIMEYA